MGINLDDMKEDTEDILSDWQQQVTIKRKSVSYNNMGEPQIQWQVVTQNGSQTIPCDIQPLRGDAVAQMHGVEITYSHQIFFPAYADVKPEDRAYTDGSSYISISHVEVQPDHVLALCQSEEE